MDPLETSLGDLIRQGGGQRSAAGPRRTSKLGKKTRQQEALVREVSRPKPSKAGEGTWKHDLFPSPKSTEKGKQKQQEQMMTEGLQIIDVPLPGQGPLTKKQVKSLVKMATDPTSLLNRMTPTSASITGHSNQSRYATIAPRTEQRPRESLSIKGTANGPTAVILSNLQQGTTSEDVRAALSVLNASIVHCHMRTPRPISAESQKQDRGVSAEVVFSTLEEAKSCVTKYNGVSADHRILSVVIKGPYRKPSTPSNLKPMTSNLRKTLAMEL